MIMLKKILIQGLLLGPLLFVPISYYILFPWLHDLVLSDFSNQLESMSSVQGVKKLEGFSTVGQLVGNGDHCDYFAASVFSTSLDREKTEENIKNVYSGKHPLQFIWREDFSRYQKEIAVARISPIEDWIAQRSDTTEADVLVYIFEPGMTFVWDYRCN